ncbi:protein FAM221B isoform X1 [Anolis carolinensis]|uniref:protein FAM221B isoform X1 n=1 Tax=Anolis carolinensis TaxID=28377 RepID=UPI002F2B4B91
MYCRRKAFPGCLAMFQKHSLLTFRPHLCMEEEEEEPAEDVPTGLSSLGTVEDEDEERTAGQTGDRQSSSSAREVDEELLPATSTFPGGDDDTTTALPQTTTLEEDGGPGESSLPSSEWGTTEPSGPPGQSPSEEASSLAQESSEGPFSSSPGTTFSPPTSPLSWKRRQEAQRSQLEEQEEESPSTGTTGGPWTEPSTSPPPPSSHEEQRKAKRKAKRTALAEYSMRPIVPAEKAELVSVAKAMHRENFGKNVKELFHLEKEAALRSMQTGLYIGWRCPEYLWDCFRVGDESKCFCGHLLKEHQVYVEKRATVPCTLPGCKCQGFMFIPSRPEEVGEFWLRRRTGFDPSTWRAQCRCKHTHEEHLPHGARACRFKGCSCLAFTSNFLCAACDRRWEEHETFFESEETRRKGGRPCGEAYLPFAEMSELRNAVLNGRPDDPSAFQALQQGQPPGALGAPSGSRPLPLPPPPRALEAPREEWQEGLRRTEAREGRLPE